MHETVDVAFVLRCQTHPRLDAVTAVAVRVYGLLLNKGRRGKSSFGKVVCCDRHMRSFFAILTSQKDCGFHLICHLDILGLAIGDSRRVAEHLLQEFSVMAPVHRSAKP